MSDKERDLGEALLKLSLLPPAVPTAPTAPEIKRIIEADRRQIKRLTQLIVGLWILVAVVMLLMFVAGGLVAPAIAKALEEAGQGNLGQPDTPFLMLAKWTILNNVLTCFLIAMLVAAGLATVLLLFRSRRATLRQINANLLEISEQLKRLAVH